MALKDYDERKGKDMQAENVVFEAGAILLLAVAALVMGRVRSD